MVVKYNLYEALGYNKSGTFLEDFKSFAELKKAILGKYKNTRFMCLDGNFILFTGLELEDRLLLDKSITFKGLRDDFKYNLATDQMYA
jgi:hypothetical protein